MERALAKKENAANPHGYSIFGTPEGIRTPGPVLRRHVLYPTELLARVCVYYVLINEIAAKAAVIFALQVILIL